MTHRARVLAISGAVVVATVALVAALLFAWSVAGHAAPPTPTVAALEER